MAHRMTPGQDSAARRSSGPTDEARATTSYNRIAGESDFAELRRRYRRFAFPATIAFFYARHAGQALDPLAEKLRHEYESETDR